MSLRQLLRKPFSPSHSTHPTHHTLRPRFIPQQSLLHHQPSLQFNSTSTSHERIDRILTRLPRFLHPYTNGLRTAPVSHIISFLILHEITAIVPLVGLAGLFHYMEWVPKSMVEGRWVREGMERFGRYFGRKGWFGFSREETAKESVGGDIDRKAQTSSIGDGNLDDKELSKERGNGEGLIQETEKRWRVGEKGGRILVEVATAYAITKVLLPARILLSVWGTPWFARVVVGRVGGLFGRGKGAAGLGNKSVAAGTGATSAEVVTKGKEGVKKIP